MTSTRIKTNITSLIQHEESLGNFKDYVDSLPIEKAVKDNLKDNTFIEENFKFYLCYPYLFAPSFEVDKNTLSALAVAGYLYYKSIIYVDNIVDSKKVSLPGMAMVHICQEESIKLLSSMFPLNARFWELWNRRRSEYMQAFQVDKVTHRITSFDDFRIHAGNKSAFGKVAIDALYLLSSSKDDRLYSRLLQSHDSFYAAFQIIDDIRDFRQDIENNQFNIAKYFLLDGADGDTVNIDAEQMATELYVSGLAEKILQMGLKCLEEAEELIKKYPLDEWKSEIRRLHNVIVTQMLNVSGYIHHVSVKNKLSNQLVKTPYDVKGSISRGLVFLESLQNKDGSWKDFFNDAGLSDTWATAYILSVLPQPYRNSPMAEKAFAFLHKGQEGLWGYNKQWMADADSSTFAMLTYFHRHNKIEHEQLSAWVKYQRPDGGFSTYCEASELISSLKSNRKIHDIVGWTQSHTCVSAAAFYLLSAVGEVSQGFKSLKAFISKEQNSNGLWNAYWWTSPIYSTATVIKAINFNVNSDMATKGKVAIKGLMKYQQANGSFGDFHVKESPFYTSMVVDSICHSKDLHDMFSKEIRKSAEWLTSVQFEDGSWQSTPCMQMPSPQVTKPSQAEKWPEGTKGLNIRVSDFSRLFSTITAVSALTNYEKWNS